MKMDMPQTEAFTDYGSETYPLLFTRVANYIEYSWLKEKPSLLKQNSKDLAGFVFFRNPDDRLNGRTHDLIIETPATSKNNYSLEVLQLRINDEAWVLGDVGGRDNVSMKYLKKEKNALGNRFVSSFSFLLLGLAVSRRILPLIAISGQKTLN